jgi:hypothetical protein
MTTARGVTALLALEDSGAEELLATLPGTDELIWPQVRMLLARAAAEEEMSSVAVGAAYSRTAALKALAVGALPSARSPRRIGRGVEHLFLVSGVTVRPTADGSENWLVDAFASTLGDRAAVLQAAPIASGRTARPALHATYSYSGALERIDAFARFSPLSADTAAAVREAVTGFARLLPFELPPETVAGISAKAISRIQRSRILDAYLLRVIERVSPRVVYLEDASYGGRATLISRLGARGIRVVEPQHGWIGASHSAYNFGAAMSESPLRETLPDTLLTFGEYWSSSVRFPGETIAVGKPHMNAMAAALPRYEEKARVVLVASSIADPAATEEFVLALRDSLPLDWTVSFRPHPSERPVLSTRYPRLPGADRVAIDDNSDVYESLRSVRAVAGVASTVLYEALAMGCHVFVRETAFSSLIVDPALGERVDGAEGTARIAAVVTTSEPSHALDPASVWHPNATSAFSEFATSAGGGDSV